MYLARITYRTPQRSTVDKISGAYLVILQHFGANAGAQPPYYMTLEMPGSDKPTFTLTTPFVPRGGRENLSAFAVVDSNNGPNYGKITVLQLPRSTNVAGPSQVASNFEAKPEVANSLSLLRQGGSDVVLGNLLNTCQSEMEVFSMYNLSMFEQQVTLLHIHCCRKFSSHSVM